MEIVVYEPDGTIQRAKFDASAPLTVGRSAGQSVFVSDPRVSRQHLVLEPIGGVWFARDAGSANGTFLNGVRVASSVSVRPGDVLELGDSRAHVLERDGARGPRGSGEDVQSWDLTALADRLAEADVALASRRRAVLEKMDALDGHQPATLAQLLVDHFDAERLAVFVLSGSHLRPIVATPSADDATTLSSIATRAATERRGLTRRRPRATQLDGGSLGDTRTLRMVDAFTLAVPAGPCVIALDGRRTAPVREGDEAALLLGLGIAMVGSFLQAALDAPPRLLPRDPESTIHEGPALKLEDLKTAEA